MYDTAVLVKDSPWTCNSGWYVIAVDGFGVNSRFSEPPSNVTT